jgi:hypothetical protein
MMAAKCRVNVGGVCYHTVEVEKRGVILVAGNYAPALWLLHRSLSLYLPGRADFSPEPV